MYYAFGFRLGRVEVSSRPTNRTKLEKIVPVQPALPSQLARPSIALVALMLAPLTHQTVVMELKLA